MSKNIVKERLHVSLKKNKVWCLQMSLLVSKGSLGRGRVPLVAAISGPYTACLSSEQKLALNIVCMAWGWDRLASCASPCEASRLLIYKATNFLDKRREEDGGKVHIFLSEDFR
jgi:hypothetical protein